MDDLDLLARFRAEVPCAEVSPQAERRFQAGLQPAGRQRRSRLGARAFPRAYLAVLAPLAAGLAVVVAMAILPGRGTNLPGRGTDPTASLTVKVLADRAAAAALARPPVRPGQWVYREIEYQQTGYTGDTAPDGVEPTWTTAAGTPGYVDGGPPVVFMPSAIPYAELGSLPAAPAALERYLGDRAIPFSVPQTEAAVAFEQIEGMLWDYVLPPRLAAELFRTLACIPGITVHSDATDIAGRHGVAFVLPGAWSPGMTLELILNPSDYSLMSVGQRFVPPGVKLTPPPRWSQGDSGPITWVTGLQLAVIRQAYVPRPDVRP
jgi:hypothetical protein